MLNMIKNLKNNLYDYLPLGYQTLFVTLYDLFQFSVVYANPNFHKQLNKIKKFKNVQSPEINKLQCHMLKNFIYKVFEVPYYYGTFKDLFRDKYHLKYLDCESFMNLFKSLPILDKKIIIENSDKIINPKIKIKFTFLTSGTTGTPLKIFYSVNDFANRLAFYEFQRREVGGKWISKRAIFTGRTLNPKHEFPYWRRSKILPAIYFSSYDLSPKTVRDYIVTLNKFKPILIEGYPNTIWELVKLARAKNLKIDFVPKGIITTAETLLEVAKEEISEFFKSPVYNFYSSTDTAPVIFQCKHGHLHILPFSGFFEFERFYDNLYKLIVTSYYSEAFPLIRYDIGDLVELNTGESYASSCEYGFPIIKKVVGRVDDVVLLPDGKIATRLSQVVKPMYGLLKKAQIVQCGYEFTVFVVPINSEPELVRKIKGKFDLVRKEMEDRLGTKIHIKFIIDKEVPYTGKKIKYVIKKC